MTGQSEPPTPVHSLFAKLLLSILAAGVIAAGLLVIRQRQIDTMHEISVIHDRLRAPHPAQFEWRLHAPTPFEAFEGGFTVQNGAAACRVRFLAPDGLTLQQTDRFDTPPRERVKLVEACTRDIAAVRVVPFDGLVTDLLRTEQGSFLLRGLRHPSDLDHETPMALMNRELPGEAETVFLLTSARLAHISSSLIREIASFGGDVRPFLPEAIADSVLEGL